MYGNPMVDQLDGGQGADDGWTPALISPEELTPLPLIDQAMPTLMKFGKLVGRGPLARYRVALLRELAVQQSSRMRVRTIQESISWMEAASVTRLVQDLRNAGLLEYDAREDHYRLSREARLVAAICGALTTAAVDYSRIIKVLGATMRLGDAMNVPALAAYQTFLSAIAVLEYDHEELSRLLADQSRESLLEAARLAEGHARDMRTLLEEQEDMFARYSKEMDFLDLDHRAHDLVARLSGLAADVVTALSRSAAVRLRGSLRVDRDELRAMIAETPIEELTDLVAQGAIPPVFMQQVDAVVAFTALEEYLQRTRHEPPEIPDPVDIGVDEPPPPEGDPVRLAAAALEQLAEVGSRHVWDWVVKDSWTEALLRNVLVIEAWARFGSAGDQSLRAELHADERLAAMQRGGVGWMSATRVVKPPGENIDAS
jgi:hypothetical protein